MAKCSSIFQRGLGTVGEPAALTKRVQVNIISSMRADPSLKHPGRIRAKTSLAKQGQLKVLHPLQGPCLRDLIRSRA